MPSCTAYRKCFARCLAQRSLRGGRKPAGQGIESCGLCLGSTRDFIAKPVRSTSVTWCLSDLTVASSSFPKWLLNGCKHEWIHDGRVNYGERCSRSTKECLKATILSLREELYVGDSAGPGNRIFTSDGVMRL